MISVIVPVYNACALLPRAVVSVFETRTSPIEVIIVDDGSTDGSDRCAQELSRRYPGVVRSVRHPQGGRRGVSASRNLGIASARGELIAFLDADDYYYPHRFHVSAKKLISDTSVDGVYDSAELVLSDDCATLGVLSKSALFGICEPLAGDALVRTLLTSQTWPCLGILCRRALLSRTGWFDESLDVAEDCNLWIKMALIGKLESGDLKRPVGVYWRHPHNTYRAGPENRVKFYRALLRAYRWAAHSPEVSPARLRLVSNAIIDQAVRTIIVCREVKRLDLAWEITKRAALHAHVGPGTWRPLVRQFQAVMRETVRARVARACRGS